MKFRIIKITIFGVAFVFDRNYMTLYSRSVNKPQMLQKITKIEYGVISSFVFGCELKLLALLSD